MNLSPEHKQFLCVPQLNTFSWKLIAVCVYVLVMMLRSQFSFSTKCIFTLRKKIFMVCLLYLKTSKGGYWTFAVARKQKNSEELKILVRANALLCVTNRIKFQLKTYLFQKLLLVWNYYIFLLSFSAIKTRCGAYSMMNSNYLFYERRIKIAFFVFEANTVVPLRVFFGTEEKQYFWIEF